MKKLGILFASVFLLGLVFQSCNNGKTYAEMKEEEREAIKRFIEREDINVISFEQFQEQDSTTNVDENQFVLFSETGVYMQIVAEGNGERLKDGRYEILARYVEEQITSDGIDSLSWNTDYGNSQMVYPDAMMLTKSGKSFSATFTSGIMYTVWGTPYVPSGWLIPFNYIKVGREISGRSKVRLIVPHSEGQSDASASVYPCSFSNFKAFHCLGLWLAVKIIPPHAPSMVTASSVVGVDASPIFTTSNPIPIKVPHTTFFTISPEIRASRPTTILLLFTVVVLRISVA